MTSRKEAYPGGWAGWKLDTLEAMARDPNLEDRDVRLAIVLLQRASEQSRATKKVTDHDLEKLLHRRRASFPASRERLGRVGYCDITSGKREKGRKNASTEYRWKDERRLEIENADLDQRILRAETEEQTVQKSAQKTVQKTVQKTAHKTVQKSIQRSIQEPVQKSPICTEPCTVTVQRSEHLIPYSPLEDSLPLKNLALEAYEAHVLAFDRWTEFEEIAARLEYDEELTRHEAEHQARMICGFEDADADGRQGAAIAPPTSAGSTPYQGADNDRDYE
jgi:histone H3/H4